MDEPQTQKARVGLSPIAIPTKFYFHSTDGVFRVIKLIRSWKPARAMQIRCKFIIIYILKTSVKRIQYSDRLQHVHRCQYTGNNVFRWPRCLHLQSRATLLNEAAKSSRRQKVPSKIGTYIYQTKRCHIPLHWHLYQHRFENLRYRNIVHNLCTTSSSTDDFLFTASFFEQNRKAIPQNLSAKKKHISTPEPRNTRGFLFEFRCRLQQKSRICARLTCPGGAYIEINLPVPLSPRTEQPYIYCKDLHTFWYRTTLQTTIGPLQC
jgi:hypothetical protein